MRLLQNRTEFPAGVTSKVNIQRQFFDSFVGQTFKVSLLDGLFVQTVLGKMYSVL